ncbi:plasmid partitioning protein RepB [Actibacterium sp. D379-3]
MARKNLLKDLMTPPPDTGVDKPAEPAAPPRYTKGAIGAVSQSIAALKSRSVNEIDPALIDAGGLTDRLDDDPADHAALVASIRDYGQQVPVLVRPHPDNADRFQVVYGRRRVLALRDLGQPVKAMVRNLDDRELVMAQGQENSARKDLTFIEKANFARQMRDAGYDRKVICDALHVDKTLISRMISVTDRIPMDLIEVIGAAPSVGRDRWLALADLLEVTETDTTSAIGLVNLLTDGDTSDKRFEGVFAALSLPDRQAQATKAQSKGKSKSYLQGDNGANLAQISRAAGKTTLIFQKKTADGFDDWLVENFAEIHRQWQQSRGE